jgi:tellurite resistance protein TerC
MFVFLMIFQYFAVPAKYQRRVLLFGVLGAVFMRLGMIMGGVWLVSQFHWILYVFGAFLVFTGIKMVIAAEQKPDLEQNPLLQWMRKHLRITKEFHEEHFLIRQNGLLYATPLLLILVLIECGDLIFALDSIPAIFAVTNDPFIIFTSNIFAILGLRALYFLLSHMADRFHLLKYGVALILVFVGAKMLIAPWFQIPIVLALVVIVLTLAISAVLSVARR